jgi:hypothetical protein
LGTKYTVSLHRRVQIELVGFLPLEPPLPRWNEMRLVPPSRFALASVSVGRRAARRRVRASVPVAVYYLHSYKILEYMYQIYSS